MFAINNSHLKQTELNRIFRSKIEGIKDNLEEERERINQCFSNNTRVKTKHQEFDKILSKHDKRNSVFIDQIDSKLETMRRNLDDKIELTDLHFSQSQDKIEQNVEVIKQLAKNSIVKKEQDLEKKI